MISNLKGFVFLLTVVCLIATALGIYLIGGIEPAQLQKWLGQAGIWAPILYIAIYTVATVLMLPSTALNLTGGAIFGIWLGTFWTSIGALIAAIVSFLYSRTVGRKALTKKLSKGWQRMDVEVRRGGMLYILAIRLLPILPYGLVNFVAGLTSVSFKDYFLGTVLGTIPGVFPFVLIGSSGLKALKTGDILPLTGALGLVGALVLGATWYRNHRD
ncbi:TVP38/TMEM64 family protein [Scytonema sp. NUACC26]|uniref:TVP38/TMEM64 family protein n=1 Tax=Scytonema sp. NUACC26 TaxID=3140176 RepID=UPI0034DC6DD8